MIFIHIDIHLYAHFKMIVRFLSRAIRSRRSIPRANVFLRRDNQTRLVLRWVKVIPLVAESGINATHREDWPPKARRNMQMSRPARASTKRGRERSFPHLFPLPLSPPPLLSLFLSLSLSLSIFRGVDPVSSWKRTKALNSLYM